MHSTATDFIKTAVTILIVVMLVAIIISIVNRGRAATNEGVETLDAVMGDIGFSQYEIYADTKQGGKDAIRLINSIMKDDTMAVLVSTLDGKNYYYSASPFNEALDGQLTGKPTLNSTESIETAPAVLIANDSFNVNAPLDTPGYISAKSKFYCTAQHDINGNLRRITFVQQ